MEGREEGRYMLLPVVRPRGGVATTQTQGDTTAFVGVGRPLGT